LILPCVCCSRNERRTKNWVLNLSSSSKTFTTGLRRSQNSYQARRSYGTRSTHAKLCRKREDAPVARVLSTLFRLIATANLRRSSQPRHSILFGISATARGSFGDQPPSDSRIRLSAGKRSPSTRFDYWRTTRYQGDGLLTIG